MRSLIFLLIFTLQVTAQAQSITLEDQELDHEEKSIQTAENTPKYLFQTGLLYSQVASLNGSFTAQGLIVGISYLATDKIDISMNFSQGFGKGTTGNGIVSLYSGFSSACTYSVLGTKRASESNVIVDGRPVFSERKLRTWTLNLGAGFDQFWFNGTSNVYPASGFAAVISSEFRAYGFWFRPELRYDNLITGNSQSVTMNSFNFTIEY